MPIARFSLNGVTRWMPWRPSSRVHSGHRLSLLPVQVSLLEYRKRKQGGGGGSRDCDSAGGGISSLVGTPTRPASHYIQDSNHHPLCHQQMQPPASPHSSSFTSASAHVPQVEEVSPPEHQGAQQPRQQDGNDQWSVAPRLAGDVSILRSSSDCGAAFLTQGWSLPLWSD